MLTGFIRVQKTLFFLKPNPVGFFGFYWVLGFIGFLRVFLFQCAVLDAIHIK